MDLAAGRAADSVCSLSQPKSDVSDFGQSKVPNSGKPEFGWEGRGSTPNPRCVGCTNRTVTKRGIGVT